MIGVLLVGLALLLLVHAGYSVVHYNALVAGLGGDEKAPIPFDVIVELAIAIFAGTAGALFTIGSFEPIYKAGEAPVNYFHKMFSPKLDFAPLPKTTGQIER